jgi:hypothetical protein
MKTNYIKYIILVLILLVSSIYVIAVDPVTNPETIEGSSECADDKCSGDVCEYFSFVSGTDTGSKCTFRCNPSLIGYSPGTFTMDKGASGVTVTASDILRECCPSPNQYCIWSNTCRSQEWIFAIYETTEERCRAADSTIGYDCYIEVVNQLGQSERIHLPDVLTGECHLIQCPSGYTKADSNPECCHNSLIYDGDKCCYSGNGKKMIDGICCPTDTQKIGNDGHTCCPSGSSLSVCIDYITEKECTCTEPSGTGASASYTCTLKTYNVDSSGNTARTEIVNARVGPRNGNFDPNGNPTLTSIDGESCPAPTMPPPPPEPVIKHDCYECTPQEISAGESYECKAKVYTDGEVTSEITQQGSASSDGSLSLTQIQGDSCPIRYVEREPDTFRCDSCEPQEVSLRDKYICTGYMYDASGNRLENTRQDKTGEVNEDGSLSLTEIQGDSCPINYVEPVVKNYECFCTPNLVGVLDGTPGRTSISCYLVDKDTGESAEGSDQDFNIPTSLSDTDLSNADNFVLGYINKDNNRHKCEIKLNPENSICSCSPDPVTKGAYTVCQVTAGSTTIATQRINTQQYAARSPEKTDLDLDIGDCKVEIIDRSNAGSCTPDGYNGVCPEYCIAVDDPDCDYGRSGLLFVNFLFHTAGLPAPQEWWNSVLQAEGFQKFFDALDWIPMTPEWFTARICSDNAGLDAGQILGGDTVDDYDTVADSEAEWIPPADFLDTESGVSFAVEFDGRNYYISWIFSQFLENQSVFRIELKNEYNGLIDTNPEQVYPYPKNGNWYWNDRTFGERLVSELPWADSRYYWAPIQNGVGNVQVASVFTSYDTACMHIDGHIFKDGEYETTEEEFCRSVVII